MLLIILIIIYQNYLPYFVMLNSPHVQNSNCRNRLANAQSHSAGRWIYP